MQLIRIMEIHYLQFFNVSPKLLTPRQKKTKKEKKPFNTFVEIQLT